MFAIGAQLNAEHRSSQYGRNHPIDLDGSLCIIGWFDDGTGKSRTISTATGSIPISVVASI